MTRVAKVYLLAWLVGLGGCTTPSLTGLLEQPAERSLMNGIRAYEEAQYPIAERALQSALDEGLKHGSDRATAHKLLAFIQCSTQRVSMCEQSFKMAKAADPALSLSKAETGNPAWGPVFRRVVATP